MPIVRRIGLHGVALAALLLAACATPPPAPQSMRDQDANFAAYRTFGWPPAPVVNGTEQPLQLVDRNIRAAIAAEMMRKGYTESTDPPDLRITYETASAEKIESNPVRIGVGVGSWGGNMGGSVNVGSPSVRNYKEGKLVIHAIDAKRNAEVWMGSISGKLTNGSLEPEAIQRAVTTAMKDFPARSAATPQG
jgi:hypothetical protein